MTDNQNPEQKARDRIDEQLRQAGWSVQQKIDFSAGMGQAVREWHTDAGPADYVLFVDKKAVGVIEAKREEEGQRLTAHEPQTEGYAAAKLKWVNKQAPQPFLYESTGVITRFTDGRDPKPRSREVFRFHRPETLRDWLAEGDSLRARLQDLPALNPDQRPAAQLHLRDCQETAITYLCLEGRVLGAGTQFQADVPAFVAQVGGNRGVTIDTLIGAADVFLPGVTVVHDEGVDFATNIALMGGNRRFGTFQEAQTEFVREFAQFGARASSRWRIQTLPGTLDKFRASLKKRSVRNGSMASKSLLPKLSNPTIDFTTSEVRIPCETGNRGSITASTCAA